MRLLPTRRQRTTTPAPPLVAHPLTVSTTTLVISCAGIAVRSQRACHNKTVKIVISDTPPYFLSLDAPTLSAEPVTDDGGLPMWRVWCRHCRAWHYHGPGDGHREAHCVDPVSPYRIVQLFGRSVNPMSFMVYEYRSSGTPAHDESSIFSGKCLDDVRPDSVLALSSGGRFSTMLGIGMPNRPFI